jgi:DNA-binding NtrC family response regulator
MMEIAVVGKDLSHFANFLTELEKIDGVEVRRLSSGASLLGLLGEKRKIDVAVLAELLADCSGLQFSRDLMKKYPLINCAIASALEPEQFHEETEGLGIFMQLPIEPKGEDAGKMMQLLESINALLR